jgi:hypothetical protein
MTNQEFFETFKLPTNEYLKHFLFTDDTTDVGFSIFKYYPKNGKFKPAINKKGEDDDVVMIRIAFSKKDLGNPKRKLFIDAVKVSRYKSEYSYANGNSFAEYNTESPFYPTNESIQISLKSLQPEDISSPDFRFDESGLFYSEYERKYYTGVELVNYVYQKHISTYNNFVTSYKIRYKKFITWSCERVGNFLLFFLNKILMFEKKKTFTNFFSFYWDTRRYGKNPATSLVNLEVYRPTYEALSYDKLKIYPLWTLSFVVIIISMFYLNTHSTSSWVVMIFFKKVSAFIISNSSNNLFFTSLVALFLVISNYSRYLFSLTLYFSLVLVSKVFHKYLWRKITV